MKVKLIISLMVLGLMALSPVWSSASARQEKEKKTTTKGKAASVRTLTGCVQKGDEPKEYVLAAKDGSTWDIDSETVKIDPHVGHTVTVTGKVQLALLHGAKEAVKEGAKDIGLTKKANERGHLEITKLTMVSPGCTK